jgi:hypothetical protein
LENKSKKPVRTTSVNIESELADHYHITRSWRTEYYTATITYGCRYLDDEEADLSLLSLLVTQRHAQHQPSKDRRNMSIILWNEIPFPVVQQRVPMTVKR